MDHLNYLNGIFHRIYDKYKHTKDWGYKEEMHCGGYDQEFYDEWLANAEEYTKYLEWLDLAKRQLFIADVKAELRKTTDPKEYEQHTVALTISPEERDTPRVCKQIVEIVKALTCIDEMWYVYEQTSKEGIDDNGWHLHFQIVTHYAPSKVKQFAQQKISRKGYTCTYVAKISDSRWLDNYMNGLKFNNDKEPGVKRTMEFRKKYNLQDIYHYAPQELSEKKGEKECKKSNVKNEIIPKTDL